MDIKDIVNQLEGLQGSFGAVVRTCRSQDILNYRSVERFPLASAAKIALGALTASAVETGELSWSLPVKELTLDSKEDSNIIYPHLQALTELPLRHVVEIMIGSHDHHCANEVANIFGGWDSVAKLVSGKFPGIQIHANPLDEERNVGELGALVSLLQDVIEAYRTKWAHFEPVVAGLVRMADKTPGIPTYRQWNMTGGLARALLNVGILGDPMSGSYLLYAIGGRGLQNRESSQEADELTTRFIQTAYEMWENGDV